MSLIFFITLGCEHTSVETSFFSSFFHSFLSSFLFFSLSLFLPPCLYSSVSVTLSFFLSRTLACSKQVLIYSQNCPHANSSHTWLDAEVLATCLKDMFFILASATRYKSHTLLITKYARIIWTDAAQFISDSDYKQKPVHFWGNWWKIAARPKSQLWISGFKCKEIFTECVRLQL